MATRGSAFAFDIGQLGKYVEETAAKEGVRFYQLLGLCIAQWASFEDHLFKICHAALKCPQQQAAIVYFRTPQLETRLNLVSELIELVLPKHHSGGHPHPSLKQWECLIKEVNKLKEIRNRLAHDPVRSEINALDSLITQSWWQIHESRGQSLRNKKKKRPLHITDLESHLVETHRLIERAAAFYKDTLLKHVPEPL